LLDDDDDEEEEEEEEDDTVTMECLVRISDNAKLTLLVSCVDANSLLHWFQTPLCGRHVLELVTIKFCLTRKCIESWYISLEGCQLIIRNPLSCSEGGSMNIPSGM